MELHQSKELFGRVCRTLMVMVLLTLMVGQVNGADRVNIRGMGMARTSVAVSTGLDAVGSNPANLAIPEGSVMTLTVLPMGAYLTSDFFTYEMYSKYFKDRPALVDLPKTDKKFILDSFQNPMGRSNAEVTARLFGITLQVDRNRTIAFTVDYGLVGGASIPREYARLLLDGNIPGSSFDINGFAIQAYWARSYTLSFGWLLPRPSFLKWLAGGVGVKMIQGYGYYEVARGAASVRTAANGMVSGSVAWQARWTNANSFSDPMHNLFQDPAGYGLGVDVGISGGVNDYLSFGISLTDMGWVDWTRDIEESSSDSVVTTADFDVFDNISSLATSVGGQKRKGRSFSSRLPGVLRLGVSVQLNKIEGRSDLPGELLLAAEYLQGVDPESPLSDQPRLSFGLEYRPTRWLPLRTGFSLGGSSNSRLAFGVGVSLKYFDLDLATEDLLWLFNGQRSSTGSVGLGMRLRIPE